MRRLCKIAIGVIMVFLVTAVLVLVAPRIFGVKLFSVLSGSMEPAYSVGDLIYAVPTDAEKIEVGDTITFVLNDDGTIATHRVVEVDKENNQFYTKGDANDLSDGRPVQEENVLGVVRFSIPKLGYLIGYMNTIPGKIVTITIIIAIIILIMLLQTQVRREAEKDDEEITQGRKPEPINRQLGKSYYDPEQRRAQRAEASGKKRIRVAPKESLDEQEALRERRREHPKVKNRSNWGEEAGRRMAKPAIPISRMPEVSEADYRYQRLQVCYKMIILMDKMWNDTMDETKKLEQEQSKDIFDIFEEEKGGDMIHEDQENEYIVS